MPFILFSYRTRTTNPSVTTILEIPVVWSMPSLKKYTLYSANSAAPGEKQLCAFFQSDSGCRNGDSCKFLHATGDKKIELQQKYNSTEVSENSSDVSSESEERENDYSQSIVKTEMTQRMDDPFADSGSGNKSKKEKGKENAKKKKRKSTDRDVFAAPKVSTGKASNNSEVLETPSKKSKKSQDVKHVETSIRVLDLTSVVSRLPVASFSIPETKIIPIQEKEQTIPRSSDKIKTDSHNSKSSRNTSKIEAQISAISSPDVAKKWQKVIAKTRQHERFDVAYDFARYKESDAQNGVKGDWVKAKPFGQWCKSYPQAIAIDCEMCETQDPLSGAKNPKALCRLSVVNADNPKEVLLDTLVKPSWPVSDYRTRINGITKEHLDSVEFTLRHAQAFMMALCSEETVIVGHAVHNDLAAINMEHHIVVDSSFLFRAKDSTNSAVSLRDTVRAVLKSEMPETHDSVNDATKALECVLHWMKRNGKVDLIERTVKQTSHKGHQLFVHRIPKQCKAEHLVNMFLKHTTVQPVEVDDILFSGNTGKTYVSFKSPAHANLAFNTIEGDSEEDLSERLQKKVFLRNGDYVRVRKMVRELKRPSPSNSESRKKTPNSKAPQTRVPSPDPSGADLGSYNQNGERTSSPDFSCVDRGSCNQNGEKVSAPDRSGAGRCTANENDDTKGPSYAPFRRMEYSKPTWWKHD
jgi:RNA exonuclease 1